MWYLKIIAELIVWRTFSCLEESQTQYTVSEAFGAPKKFILDYGIDHWKLECQMKNMITSHTTNNTWGGSGCNIKIKRNINHTLQEENTLRTSRYCNSTSEDYWYERFDSDLFESECVILISMIADLILYIFFYRGPPCCPENLSTIAYQMGI